MVIDILKLINIKGNLSYTCDVHFSGMFNFNFVIEVFMKLWKKGKTGAIY